jgi:LPS-assembly protein
MPQRRQRQRTTTVVIAAMIAVAGRPAHAEILPEGASWTLCRSPFVTPPQLKWTMPPATQPGVTTVESDALRAETGDGRVHTFEGNTLVQRDDQWLRADRVEYTETSQDADIAGNVQFGQEEIILEGARGRYSFSTRQGAFEHARVFLPERHARADASEIALVSPGVSTLTDIRFTTCDVDDNSWYLRAQSLRLDTVDDVGTARNVWAEFKGVPVFYFPYLSFPLADRKSGLLFPTLGRSSRLGHRVAVPYYWNIAPNQDATFTLQHFTERGQQVLGEYRYLQSRYRGEVDLEVLPNDHVTRDDRVYAALRHHWSPVASWVADLDYSYVSDDDYFRDFGDRLSTASISQLERSARVTYLGPNTQLRALLLDYQTLDATIAESVRPYRKLPEVTLHADAPDAYLGLRWQLNAEAIRFAAAERVSGTRVLLFPSASYPVEGLSGFLRPKLGVRHISYALEQQASDVNARPAVTAPVFSVDSGLFLEREFTLEQASWQQTLEPRLFYLYVPYRDQRRLLVDEDGITERVFDTSLTTLGYAQLFQENRFAGGDRIGDANQATLAVTTRFLDPRGVDRLNASLGRIYYLRDRTVTLPGAAPETAAYSNLIGELRARPATTVYASITGQWDEAADDVSEGVVQLRYQPYERKIANLAYRLTRDPNNRDEIAQKDTDVSLFWPLHRNWNAIARHNYSLKHRHSKEWLAGVEYDSCCWALRVVSRTYVSNINDPAWGDHPNESHALLLQLELKGLSNVGQSINSLLENTEHGIVGY